MHMYLHICIYIYVSICVAVIKVQLRPVEGYGRLHGVIRVWGG